MSEIGRTRSTYEKAKQEMKAYEKSQEKQKRVQNVRTSSGVRFGYEKKGGRT